MTNKSRKKLEYHLKIKICMLTWVHSCKHRNARRYCTEHIHIPSAMIGPKPSRMNTFSYEFIRKTHCILKSI